MGPWVNDVSLFLARARADRPIDHVRRRAGHAARHRSRHLSLRHLVERDDRRRLHRPRRAAARDRRRARRRQGLHHARRRRTAADRADRRDRQPPARDRAGVRRGDGPSAPLRLVRRGRGALRRARQRSRRARADQARRARRDDGAADLHRLSLRAAPTLTEFPGETRAAGRVRAGLRVDAGVDDADQGRRARFADLPAGCAALHRAARGADRRARRDRVDRLGARRHDHPRRFDRRALVRRSRRVRPAVSLLRSQNPVDGGGIAVGELDAGAVLRRGHRRPAAARTWPTRSRRGSACTKSSPGR